MLCRPTVRADWCASGDAVSNLGLQELLSRFETASDGREVVRELNLSRRHDHFTRATDDPLYLKMAAERCADRKRAKGTAS